MRPVSLVVGFFPLSNHIDFRSRRIGRELNLIKLVVLKSEYVQVREKQVIILMAPGT